VLRYIGMQAQQPQEVLMKNTKSTTLKTTVKTTVIGLALAGSVLALGACASDGYSRSSVGVGFSSSDYGYDGYGSRRDRDRDGVPNRYDYDRDGDGVSNRFDWAPNNPYRR